MAFSFSFSSSVFFLLKFMGILIFDSWLTVSKLELILVLFTPFVLLTALATENLLF
jgi:hypothetical protein